MTIYLKNKDTLIFEDFKFKCCVGKNGISKNKEEGDNKTPLGKFSLGDLYFRADKIKKPQTKIKCIPIKKNMGWCDDVKNKKFYNRLIDTKKKVRHEKLFRNDFRYNLFIPLSYNSNPVKLGKGSAIFLHLTKNYKATAGCIALKEKDFLILLKVIKKKTKILIN